MYHYHIYCILFLVYPINTGNKYLNFLVDLSLLSFHYTCEEYYKFKTEQTNILM